MRDDNDDTAKNDINDINNHILCQPITTTHDTVQNTDTSENPDELSKPATLDSELRPTSSPNSAPKDLEAVKEYLHAVERKLLSMVNNNNLTKQTLLDTQTQKTMRGISASNLVVIPTDKKNSS